MDKNALLIIKKDDHYVCCLPQWGIIADNVDANLAINEVLQEKEAKIAVYKKYGLEDQLPDESPYSYLRTTSAAPASTQASYMPAGRRKRGFTVLTALGIMVFLIITFNIFIFNPVKKQFVALSDKIDSINTVIEQPSLLFEKINNIISDIAYNSSLIRKETKVKLGRDLGIIKKNIDDIIEEANSASGELDNAKEDAHKTK